MMEHGVNDIVWAKVRGYPWWPAEINKLPSADQPFYKVVFIAQDNYANMHPKDIKHYQQHHPDFSKKKMKNLAHAITQADQILRRRQIDPTHTKDLMDIEPLTKPKHRRTYKNRQSKAIRKAQARKKQKEEEQQQQQQQHESIQEEPMEEEPSAGVLGGRNSQQAAEKEPGQEVGEERGGEQMCKGRKQLGNQIQQMDSSEDEKWLNESQDRLDRGKIENVEKTLQRFIDEIKQSRFVFDRQVFAAITEFSGEELIHTKITNKINFIAGHLRKASQEEQANWLGGVQAQLKKKVVQYLYDTSYYDNCLRLIERNRRTRRQCQGKIMEFLEAGYRVKHELAELMASRLVQQLNSFDPQRQRELLNDLREGRLQLGKVNNKAATERAVETLVAQYS